MVDCNHIYLSASNTHTNSAGIMGDCRSPRGHCTEAINRMKGSSRGIIKPSHHETIVSLSREWWPLPGGGASWVKLSWGALEVAHQLQFTFSEPAFLAQESVLLPISTGLCQELLRECSCKRCKNFSLSGFSPRSSPTPSVFKTLYHFYFILGTMPHNTVNAGFLA